MMKFRPNICVRALNAASERLLLQQYLRFQKRKVAEIRGKAKVKVLFVLSDVPLWKTEQLYKEMLSHERFEPVIGTAFITADTVSESQRKYMALIDYLNERNYPYRQLSAIRDAGLNPDIIFYQQPYTGFISETLSFQNQLNSLICYVTYGFMFLAPIPKNSFSIDLRMHRYCWQIYLENELTFELSRLSLLKGKNCVITGVPMQDVLSRPDSAFENPWRPQERPKKRIIWAPHHTLPIGENLLSYSTFLDVAEIMLELAEKYSDEVQFAFKPHPFLRKKLVAHWGEEKTNAYYNKWQAMPNGQLAEGGYLGLFKHSDAMIHDCGSFTVEYCYTKNPVMYLAKEQAAKIHREEVNRFGQMAFDLHEKGCEREEIESFVQSVIRGEDKRREERESFYDNYLLPPHGKSASANIINAILGEEEYQNQR